MRPQRTGKGPLPPHQHRGWGSKPDQPQRTPEAALSPSPFACLWRWALEGWGLPVPGGAERVTGRGGPGGARSVIPARWFPPGSAPLLISCGQAARPLSAQAQHPLASAPGGKREEARLSGAGERAGRSRSSSLSLGGIHHDA